MSDDNVTNLESKREALLDAYDDLCDEIVESLYALPQDLKRDVISAVCCEHDWSHFAEYIVATRLLRGCAMSALPPKADIIERDRHVRFVPEADSCTAAYNARFTRGIANIRQ